MVCVYTTARIHAKPSVQADAMVPVIQPVKTIVLGHVRVIAHRLVLVHLKVHPPTPPLLIVPIVVQIVLTLALILAKMDASLHVKMVVKQLVKVAAREVVLHLVKENAIQVVKALAKAAVQAVRVHVARLVQEIVLIRA